MRDIPAFLAERQQDPDKEIAVQWMKFEELYNKKLWHQLTLELLEFVKHPSLQKDDGLLKMYTNFIQDFESKMNALSLTEIVGHVVEQVGDSEEAIKFLNNTQNQVKSCREAVALCKVFIGQIKLHRFKDEVATKELVLEVDSLLNEVAGITTIHGRFYLLWSELCLIQNKHADYYRTALRYLGCIELATLTEEEKNKQAYQLGLSALLGEGVYNFGELLAHDILQSLSQDRVWMIRLLYAFNSGNIFEFNELKVAWGREQQLVDNEKFLREKISLLCLMEMTFKRSATDRLISFEELAKETQKPIDQVEMLVMKALSKGLVKGSIDQVAEKVHLTWVQPRVLDKKQIANMMQRLDLWCKDVHSMEDLLEKKANDILTL